MQVSRRLARRIYQDIRSQKYGYVQIAAQAYIYLLQKLPPGDSSLFARELIVQHVVRPQQQKDIKYGVVLLLLILHG